MAGIIVVFPKYEDAKTIKTLLIRNGFNAVASCTSGGQAISRADDLGEGIIISGYRLSDMMYTDIYDSVEGRFEMILVSSPDRLVEEDISIATLTYPLKVRDLINTVEMMEHNILSRRYGRRRKSADRAPEEKAVIDQAKAVLMEKNNISEQEAHRYIQKTSMNSGNNMVETAKMILTIMYRE